MPAGGADHLLGDVDAANARLRELAREEQRPLAGAGAHLERPLGRGLHVQERGRQRGEVLHRAGAGAPVPAGRGAIEEAPHRAANRRPGPGRAHDQPVQHAADDADPPGRGSSLGGRHQALASRVAADRIHIGHLAVPRVRGARPASLRGRCRAARPPERSPRPSLAALAALAARGLRRRTAGGESTSAALPAGCQEAPDAAAQAGRPEAAAADRSSRARRWWRPSTRAAAASRSRSTPGTRRRR